MSNVNERIFEDMARQLVAWNRNPNGDGVELAEICMWAESLIGSNESGSPRHGFERIPAVVEMIEAASECTACRSNAAFVRYIGEQEAVEISEGCGHG